MVNQSKGSMAGAFQPPKHLVILQTEDWVLNHRVDSALPGYLILGVRMPTNDLSRLCPEALAQLGTLLANAQSALTMILKPEHLYIGRYGHTLGHALHFHLIPICGWVKRLFFDDPRYRVLRKLSHCSGAADADETDGAELTLYAWREFCESPTPPPISGPSVYEVVERMKALMSVRKRLDSRDTTKSKDRIGSILPRPRRPDHDWFNLDSGRSVSSLSQPTHYASEAGARPDSTSPGANIGAIGCRGPDSRSAQALPVRRLRRSPRVPRRRTPGLIGAKHAEEFIRRSSRLLDLDLSGR
jgi:diadenosine tetraphosphate (Ap4A) HIT family hydrolase